MKTSSCQDVKYRLHDFVDLELQEEQRRLVRVHVRACTSCRGVQEQLALLKQLVHAKLRRPLVPAGLRTVISRKYSLTERRTPKSSLRVGLAWAATVIIAATAAVAVLVTTTEKAGLAHAAMIMGCLDDFGLVDFSDGEEHKSTDCKQAVLADIRSKTRMELDCVPCLKGYVGCTVVEIRGVEGLRLDYRDAELGCVSVYVLPLESLRCPDVLQEELAGDPGHCCRCVLDHGLRVHCRRSDEYVFNFLMSPEADLAHRPGLAFPKTLPAQRM